MHCVLTPHFAIYRMHEAVERAANSKHKCKLQQPSKQPVDIRRGGYKSPRSPHIHEYREPKKKRKKTVRITKLTFTMYQFNRTHSHRASVSSSVSSSDFHHDSPTYSSPYGSLSDPMVDDFLHDVGHMSPHNTHYESMDIDPSRLHSAGSPTTIDPRQANMHQEHLDAFIDFDAERSGRTFEVRHTTPAGGQHFDPNDWSWFDSMVTAPNGHPQHHHQHHHHPGGFLTDTHPSELSQDSPGALDSSPSSYSR